MKTAKYIHRYHKNQAIHILAKKIIHIIHDINRRLVNFRLNANQANNQATNKSLSILTSPNLSSRRGIVTFVCSCSLSLNRELE